MTGVDRRVKLLEILRSASADLADVHEKKMFGCDALFARGRIFALIWKTGRIGVKLPEAARYEALASQRGAAPWTLGDKVIKSWVLVPPKLEDPKALGPWLEEAHAMASASPKKKKAAKRTTAKKAAAKKPKRAKVALRAGRSTPRQSTPRQSARK